MATSGSGTSVVATPIAPGSYTLGQLVGFWRDRLDDKVGPDYLWSNEEFTEYVDSIQKQLCTELLLLLDRHGAEVCQYQLVQGNGLIDISPRLLHIVRAVVDGSTQFLELAHASDMDNGYPIGWDTAATAQAEPKTLVIRDMGLNKVYLYPPMLAATGLLKLVAYRLPLVDLVWATHSTLPLEIDRYSHLLMHAVMQQAYLKQDAETYDPDKAEQHGVLWEKDKEKIRRMVNMERGRASSASPVLAFM